MAARCAGDRQETQHSLRALPNALPVRTAHNKHHKYRQARYKEIEKDASFPPSQQPPPVHRPKASRI